MTPQNQSLLLEIAEADKALYSTILFLPETLRPAAAALYRFHLEICRIPLLVSEAMTGEIRLQWWRDTLTGERNDEAAANPLAKSLLEVISTHSLPKEGFVRYLDAKTFDLYNDPMPDRASLEGYFGETESFVLQMICQCAGAEANSNLADSCGHAGVMIGITNLLARLGHDRSHQRVFIPGDLLSAAGLDSQSWLSMPGKSHETAVRGLVSLGEDHSQRAKKAIRQLPKALHAIFLPVALADAQLKVVNRTPDILTNPVTISPLKQQLTIWKAALLGL